jgi:hypothetical protein
MASESSKQTGDNLASVEQGKDKPDPGDVKCLGCSNFYPEAMMKSYDVAPMYPGVGFIVTFCPSCMARSGRENSTQE